jgi:putative endonuclease
MPTQNRQTGNAGEEYTAKLIEKSMGMRVLGRNYRGKTGEIDIIAQHGEYICFIEVKTRKPGGIASGEQAITKSKQCKIIKTALLWMQRHEDELQPRFDVCVVSTGKDGKPTSHEYYEAAFDGSVYSR